MAVYTTEGIILKRSSYGEASRMLTVLTPYKGKKQIVAKGVRRITSRRAGNVELLNRVKIQVYSGRGMDLLTEAESLETFPNIKGDLKLSTYGSHLAEITNRLVPENSPQPAIYKLLLEVLTTLEHQPRQLFIRAYEVKLLKELGFWSTQEIDVSAQIKQLLQKLEKSSWREIAEISVSQDMAVELASILRYYMERILESELKSILLIEKLKTSRG